MGWVIGGMVGTKIGQLGRGRKGRGFPAGRSLGKYGRIGISKQQQSRGRGGSHTYICLTSFLVLSILFARSHPPSHIQTRNTGRDRMLAFLPISFLMYLFAFETPLLLPILLSGFWSCHGWRIQRLETYQGGTGVCMLCTYRPQKRGPSL